MLRYLWPQWTVEWAVHGVADLADHLHIDRATVLTRETFEEGFRPNPVLSDEELSRYEGEGNVTIITIKRGDGRVLDYRSSLLPGTMLSVGPPLLDFLLSKGHPIVLPHERGIRDDAAGGAFFDLTAHEVWVWNPAVLDPRYIEALKQSWTGWRVNGHVDGLVHQVALSGRDASSIMVPADEAAADLVKELTKFATLSNVIVPVMTNDVPEGADPIEIASGFVATRAEMNSVEEFQQLLHRLFRSALEQRS
ncbi:MAG TPA: hypothetical protein VK669_02920 [Candidatus Limnocylindrales bacterium]|nr:hypothetical protein [Candidatus Limnocylindrales bacterium]